ncbi:MAG TPA: response regulator [Spirochaetota bacterium]|nr:response regulator [Spirochaetota bacterium]HPJ35990.1 response regulator [Spirochaetota bacterium]
MPKKLLIIDDEEYIRLPIQDYFEDCGWDVDSFSSAEEALEYLGAGTADCVIVDMRLSGMSGLSFIERANEIRPGLRYIIYTGSVEFSITENLRMAGVSEEYIINKPVDNLNVLLCAAEGNPVKGK